MNYKLTDCHQLRDAQFKDNSPLDTVKRIKNILATNNIETEEVWYETSVPYCFVLSVFVKNSTFKVNGKGLTKEFALASAYGELMERLQLGYIGNRYSQKDGHYSGIEIQDITVSVTDLYAANPMRYNLLAQRFSAFTGKEESGEALIKSHGDTNGNIQATAYFNLTRNSKDLYPTYIQMRVYASNGCAAGNTPEEAIVQAISEIVERHHQLRIISERLTVPTIPDNYLKQFPVAYSIIEYVRSHGYKVIIKDCSLDSGFPVIGVCIIDEKSGKYHTHFGAYPIFEIALERSLTESFQGRTIDTIANFENFIYKKEAVHTTTNITQEIVKGSGERFPNFFVGNSPFTFQEDLGFRGENNKALLRECIAFFSNKGYEVLVRDCSCLGFPTYQVIVPGYSEVYPYRLSPATDDFRYANFAVDTLRNPSSVKPNVLMGFLMHTKEMSRLAGNIGKAHGFLANSKLAATLDIKTQNYYLYATYAYVYYAFGRYAEVLKCIDILIPLADSAVSEILICLKRCLSMRLHNYPEDEIRETLEFFHKANTVDNLYQCFSSKANPFDKFTLHCDLSCTESCPIHEQCFQKQFIALNGLINKKTKEISMDDCAAYLQDILAN